MTGFRQGDVVLVSFPFSDQSAEKRRPAVVVSANWFNRNKPDCVVAAITSRVPSQLEPDEQMISGAEASSAGLIYDSVVKAGMVFTIEQSRIMKQIGSLPPKARVRVLECVGRVFSDRSEPG